MREISFRGKRADNGEWVYGYFYEDIGSFIKELASSVSTNTHLVDRSTVGQYTGLTDKNCKRIFEGDIIRTKEYGKCLGRVNVSGFDIFSVVYSPAVFRIERESPPRGFNLVGNGADYEIIGNIHDNPELLVEVSHNG